ncbi:hypothetical protein U1Q18_031824 [Sarracenia purpurea var. burkii]
MVVPNVMGQTNYSIGVATSSEEGSKVTSAVAAKNSGHSPHCLRKKGMPTCVVSEKVAGRAKSGSKLKMKLTMEKKGMKKKQRRLKAKNPIFDEVIIVAFGMAWLGSGGWVCSWSGRQMLANAVVAILSYSSNSSRHGLAWVAATTIVDCGAEELLAWIVAACLGGGNNSSSWYGLAWVVAVEIAMDCKAEELEAWSVAAW